MNTSIDGAGMRKSDGKVSEEGHSSSVITGLSGLLGVTDSGSHWPLVMLYVCIHISPLLSPPF